MHKDIQTTENKPSSTLAQRVMKRIRTEQVQPASKWWFICVEYSIWVAWLSTVVLGALALAVILYVGNYARFALYEATHDRVVDFVLEILPTLWLTLFVSMIVLAYINVRRTKRGYLYSMGGIIFSSIVLSVVGGVVLHFFKVGYLIDVGITKIVPMYESYEEFEEKIWQQPEEGRLLGRLQDAGEDDTFVYVRTENKQDLWQVNTTELSGSDLDLLLSGKRVRILGTTTNMVENIFYACGVFPWLFGSDVDVQEMKKQRQLFIGRMYTHKEAAERVKGIEREVYGVTGTDTDSSGVCGEIAAVKRMHF